MKKLIVICSVLSAGLALADNPVPQPIQDLVGGQWTVSLGGSGATATAGDWASSFGAEVDIGRTAKIVLPVEGGLRQGFNYDSSATVISSRMYLDATLFTIAKRVDVFAGGNVGMDYGNTPMRWEASPEVGLRWWIKPNIAAVGRVEVPFALNPDQRFDDVLRFFVGFEVKL